MEITFCELREKDVVNTADGKNLGKILDMVLNVCGNVTGIIVPGERRMLRCVSKDDSLFIPWKSIVKIGEDVILVELKSHNRTLESANDD